MNPNLKKALRVIGFGVLLWVIMFAVVSALLTWYNQFIWVKVIVAIIAGVIAFILTGYIKPKNIARALALGLIWVIVGVILDALVTMRFNAEIFQSWSLWLGYFLVLVAPLFGTNKKTLDTAIAV